MPAAGGRAGALGRGPLQNAAQLRRRARRPAGAPPRPPRARARRAKRGARPRGSEGCVVCRAGRRGLPGGGGERWRRALYTAPHGAPAWYFSTSTSAPDSTEASQSTVDLPGRGGRGTTGGGGRQSPVRGLTVATTSSSPAHEATWKPVRAQMWARGGRARPPAARLRRAYTMPQRPGRAAMNASRSCAAAAAAAARAAARNRAPWGAARPHAARPHTQPQRHAPPSLPPCPRARPPLGPPPQRRRRRRPRPAAPCGAPPARCWGG